jgi:hypothetical protein
VENQPHLGLGFRAECIWYDAKREREREKGREGGRERERERERED